MGKRECVYQFVFHVKHKPTWYLILIAATGGSNEYLPQGKDFIITPLITRLTEAKYAFSYRI
jgi:hypothetical protein